jgi:hypothetical protein
MNYSPWRSRLIALGISATVVLWAARARAGIIASEDFSSYAAGSEISNASNSNGGTGWAGPWGTGSATTNITRHVQNPVFTSLDNGAVSTVTSNVNATNLLFRQLSTPQTGTFYVGLIMRTSLMNPTTNDFLQFYVNATTAASDSAAYGGGVARGTPTPNVAGSYFVRRGSNASPASGAGQTVNSSLLHTYGQDTVLVFKFAKSLGGVSDPYDLVSLFVNQASEGTADAALSGTNGSTNANLASIDVFHIRYGGSSATGTQIATLAFDDLVFADSYADAYSFATTGIPEPNLTAVAGLVAAAWGLMRRRMRK